MFKNLTLLLFILFSSYAFAQNITIKGKVTDEANLPLESATIYITKAKDSSVVDYTISGKTGAWEIKTSKIEEPVFLKISFVGLSNHTQEVQSIVENRDFGTIKLAELPTQLNEVVIQAEAPPIRIKKDTLEFNASSFKVRPDANVESLLKQLPGVVIDSNGKITVNGKEVNQILVNGKPFFDKDGKIALQNLPAELINKVQVSDTKTKQEELSGQSASSDNASINLTIDEDKNKGLFGKFMGGYGSDDRYESSAIFNYFKGDRRISVLASSNNINANGFSMDEIFDNMGGGRNMNVWANDDGGMYIGGQMFGGGYGITQSNMIGTNYSDTWAKDFDANASYFYNSASTENDNRTHSETLLPTNNPEDTTDKRNITDSVSRSKNDKYAHNFSTEFEFKPDSTSTISFTPRFTKANQKNSSTSASQTTNQDNVLLNDTKGSYYNENDNTSFKSGLDYFKSINKRGRAISLSLSNENNLDDGSNYNQSETNFYGDEDGDGNPDRPADIRNQVRNNRRTSDMYSAEFQFTQPITDTLKIMPTLQYRFQRSVEDRKGYDFDNATGDFTTANDELTNYLSSTTSSVTPGVGLQFNKSKYSVSFEAGTQITQFKNNSSYMGNNYSLNKEYMLPAMNANLRYKFGKSTYLSMYYSYDVRFPQASQVLPVEDLSNPLYTSIGNPNLDPTKTNRINLSFRNYDYATRSGYGVYSGVSLMEDAIIQFTEIDESAKQTTTYANTQGTYYGWLGFYFNKQFKKDAHTYRFGLDLNLNNSYSKGITNGQLFTSKEYSLRPELNFTYEYGELLTITPSYIYSFEKNKYTNYTIGSASNFTHEVKLQTTSYWPKNIVFGNDFGYNYNSQMGEGFKKDFFLWNTSLGYQFLDKQFLLKAKVYDLLNQNLGTSRSISPTGIYEQQNTVLKRYVMFSLTYTLKKFGAKDRKETKRFSRF